MKVHASALKPVGRSQSMSVAAWIVVRMESVGVAGAVPALTAEGLAPYYPSAIVATRAGAVRFLVEFGPEELIASQVAGIGGVAAVLEAVGDLARLARECRARMRVTIDDLRIVGLVQQAAPVTTESPLDVTGTVSWQAARLFAELYEAVPDPEPEADLSTLVVGTDGSLGHEEAAWAWVDDQGRHDWGQAVSEAIDACELEAIWQALRSVGGRDVLVLTDSRNAVRFARRPDVGSGRVMDMALKVRDVTRRRTRDGFATQIAWVPAHSGIGVNEIAHRLALNGLRQVAFGTPDRVAQAVAASIVADLTDSTEPTVDPRWAVSFGPAGGANLSLGTGK